MKIEIKLTNGKWLANGKTYDELNSDEKEFMDLYFKKVKLTQKSIIS